MWFMDRLPSWDLVALIEEYQYLPTEKRRERILKRFDTLFIQPSIWLLLNKQKALTAQKMDKLLYPLFNRTIPTNNNLAERDLRGRVIKRKISLFNQTLKGAQAWDLWYSLKETTRKLGINFWKYIEDRIFLRFEVPSLTALSIN
jgi:Transposase IS66 family